MIVVIPKNITDSMVSNNTAPASSTTDYPGLVTWTVTSFSAGSYVLYTPDQYIYQAAVTTSTAPPTGAAEDPPKWVRIAKNNPLRLFDGVVSDPTIADGGFSLDLSVGAIYDSFSCFNTSGASQCVLTVVEDSTEIYSRTIELLDNSEIVDWWSYYYAPVSYKSSFAVYDLPPTLDGVLTVEFVTSGSVSVGECVVGSRRILGTAIDGSGFENNDLSTVTYDTFGNVTGKNQRANIDLVSYDVRLDSDKIGYLRNTLKAIGKTTECVWAGSTSEDDDLLAYGFYDSFSCIVYSDISTASIKVRTVA